jgi:hypothetical protein
MSVRLLKTAYVIQPRLKILQTHTDVLILIFHKKYETRGKI